MSSPVQGEASEIGVSGEQIRREQAESKRRSRLGARRVSPAQAPRSLSVIVGGIEIDWGVVLLAGVWREHGMLGLVLAAFAIALGLASSKLVTVESEGERIFVSVTRPLARAGRQTRLVVDAAQLHYWNGWFSRSFVLRGSNVSVAVASRGGSRLKPPLGVLSLVSARPPFRLSARSIALNLPNLVLMGACIATVWGSGRHSFFVVLLACNGLAAALASCLIGAPRLVVSHVEPTPTDPRTSAVDGTHVVDDQSAV